MKILLPLRPAPAERLTDTPLISVVMPAYNARAYIEEAIRSVLNQDYPAIELIVVDDGSQDGTSELAEGLGGRVRVLRQTNAGPAAARNRGMEAASGEFIAFLDADDVWLPGKASMQVRYLRDHPAASLVFSDFVRWYSQADGTFLAPPYAASPDTPLNQVPVQSGWIYKDILLDSVIHIITAMVRRSVIETVGGFDESLATGEDYDFWLRVSHRYRADRLNRTLACYRIHRTSITKIPRRENNEYQVLLKALAAYGPAGPDNVPAPARALRERMFQLCFSHGYFHVRSGDPQVAQEAFRAAAHHSPFRPKVWAYWMWATGKHLFSGIHRYRKAAM